MGASGVNPGGWRCDSFGKSGSGSGSEADDGFTTTGSVHDLGSESESWLGPQCVSWSVSVSWSVYVRVKVKPLYQARESSLVLLCLHPVQFMHKT